MANDAPDDTEAAQQLLFELTRKRRPGGEVQRQRMAASARQHIEKIKLTYSPACQAVIALGADTAVKMSDFLTALLQLRRAEQMIAVQYFRPQPVYAKIVKALRSRGT